MIIEEKKVDELHVKEFDSRLALGVDAARMVGEKIVELQKEKEYVNMIFASAPSQNEFLEALVQHEGIDWSRVAAFHMDEYIGLDTTHVQSFASFLRRNLFSLVSINRVHFINGNAENIEEECKRYESLLNDNPADIVCMGIGENTHIAFNDPHVADFEDIKKVKIIDLDDKSRQQQVNDGCFPTFESVPTHAVTLTIPALLRGKYIYCMVPGINKAKAIYQTLNEEVSPQFPSTILRKHPNAVLFIDAESAQQVKE